ncbi:MAG TPA: hypothetical protein VH583_25875 [Vicinamibacterales bacterium]
MTFREALAEQRWDDHRFYHHSRINQSLHLVSALSFICSYVLLFVQPVAAVFVAWLFAMPTRQAGHFFFEPKGYDHANHATHEHKEQVKVGYNLFRKAVLLSIWALSPLVLLADPTCFGLLSPQSTWLGILDSVARIWLFVGAGAVLFRTVHLFFLRDVQTGLVWCTKILTDPFHDVKLYGKSPLYLFRGELFDPIVSDDAA